MFASQFEWQCRQNLNEKSVQKNQNLAISRWHQIITTFSDNNRRIIFIYLKLKLLYLFTEEEKSTKSEEWKVWRFDRHSSEKFLLNFLALSFLWWVILKILYLILLNVFYMFERQETFNNYYLYSNLSKTIQEDLDILIEKSFVLMSKLTLNSSTSRE